MGTRALWQSTNQTTGHGTQHSGRGSARRVREFRIGSDTFAELGRGDAIIYTTLGPDPRRATIVPVEFDAREPERIGDGARHRCELCVHPEERLATASGVARGLEALRWALTLKPQTSERPVCGHEGRVQQSGLGVRGRGPAPALRSPALAAASSRGGVSGFTTSAHRSMHARFGCGRHLYRCSDVDSGRRRRIPLVDGAKGCCPSLLHVGRGLRCRTT